MLIFSVFNKFLAFSGKFWQFPRQKVFALLFVFFGSADVLSGRHFVRTGLDVLSERHSVRTGWDVLSGRHLVRTVLCDIFSGGPAETFCQEDIWSGPPYGWLCLITSGNGWLWGGFRVVVMDGFGGYEWLMVVMGWKRVVFTADQWPGINDMFLINSYSCCCEYSRFFPLISLFPPPSHSPQKT